ncbi:recombination protein RecR [Candidatus Peregrinibacteria bacterium]|nr:recombination protein RecR [Candidatus Peregrinibacteria bacterium]
MSSFLPKSIQDLVDEFSKLPSIGPKSAQRLAMHLLHSPEKRIQGLADAVNNLKKGIQFCGKCWNLSEDNLCKICVDGAREARQICVVEEILDVVALEKTGEFKGVYHVLHGALSPVDGIGPEHLKMAELLERIHQLKGEDALPSIEDENKEIEVILATNPGMEGETTALYLMKKLVPFDIKITRIARGLPVGGDLDYADEITLSRALQGRAQYN